MQCGEVKRHAHAAWPVSSHSVCAIEQPPPLKPSSNNISPLCHDQTNAKEDSLFLSRYASRWPPSRINTGQREQPTASRAISCRCIREYCQMRTQTCPPTPHQTMQNSYRKFLESDFILVARTTTPATATLRILLILLLIIVLLILRPSPDSAWRWCSSLRRIIFMVWRL